jgi:hypothetical protein
MGVIRSALSACFYCLNDSDSATMGVDSITVSAAAFSQLAFHMQAAFNRQRPGFVAGVPACGAIYGNPTALGATFPDCRGTPVGSSCIGTCDNSRTAQATCNTYGTFTVTQTCGKQALKRL